MTRRFPIKRSTPINRFQGLHFLTGVVWSAVLSAMAASAFAQQAQSEDKSTSAGKPSWEITPTVAASITSTDNVAPGSGEKKSDLITTISPGFRIDGRSARVSGNFNFSIQKNIYAESAGRNNQQRSLAANGKVELVEGFLFIDVHANISQAPISAFGTQGVGNELINTNRTETTSHQWSPYIRGRLGMVADYELRYTDTQTSADSGVLATGTGAKTTAWTGRFSGDTPLSALNWSVNAEANRVKLGAVRETRADSLVGTFEYRIDPQIRFHISGGAESNNYSSAQVEQHGTSGYGIEWALTERSQLSLRKDRHSYGDSYSAAFSNRTELSSWKLSDSRSVSLPAQQMTLAPVSSAAELLNLLLTSAIPDPIERARTVDLRLQQAGISPNTLVYGNVVSSQPFIQRRQEASVSLTGASNTVTFTIQRSRSERIGNSVGLIGDLASSSNILQSGVTSSWMHKLSPDTSLTLNVQRSRSSGDTTNLGTQLRSVSWSLTTKLGMKTSGVLGLRQTSSDNNSGITYDERALTASILVTF